jgi:hypothetical protein
MLALLGGEKAVKRLIPSVLGEIMSAAPFERWSCARMNLCESASLVVRNRSYPPAFEEPVSGKSNKA